MFLINVILHNQDKRPLSEDSWYSVLLDLDTTDSRLHRYADDSTATTWLSHCIADVATWFSVNRLRLNPAKTLIIWIGWKRQVEKVNILGVPIMATSVQTVDSARDLGVVVDSHLTMTTHVSAVCRAAYYQFWQMLLLIRSLSFVSTCLDYCNSLLYGISDNLYRRLEAVQNAVARLITNMRRCEHITPVLQQLHWLPVHQRVQFKIAVLVYKAPVSYTHLTLPTIYSV